MIAARVLTISRKIVWVGVGIAGSLVASGCGSGTEPLQLISQQGVFPQLASPISDSAVYVLYPFSQSGSGVTTSREGFDYSNTSGVGLQVTAPAPGVVSQIDVTAGAASALIIHSLHVMTRISGMQTVTVQVGANVQTGSGIGVTSNNAAQMTRFTVYYDNSIVCPLSFMTYGAQRRVQTAVLGSGSQTACL